MCPSHRATTTCDSRISSTYSAPSATASGMPTTLITAKAIRNGPSRTASVPAISTRQGEARRLRTAPPARIGKSPTNGMPISIAARIR